MGRTSDGGDAEDRRDLAAMIVPLGGALMQAESPILDAHGLTMWGYIVLQALSEGPTRSQIGLAEAIGADKTRIIGTLDALQERGLIDRWPDPEDRRIRQLAITTAGRRLCESAKAGIQRKEEMLLARLPAADRRGFLRALATLSALSREDIVGDLDATQSQVG